MLTLSSAFAFVWPGADTEKACSYNGFEYVTENGFGQAFNCAKIVQTEYGKIAVVFEAREDMLPTQKPKSVGFVDEYNVVRKIIEYVKP